MFVVHLEPSDFYRRMMKQIIRGNGDEYEGVSEPASLYALLERTRFDIIFSSLVHRGISQPEVIRNIKERSEGTPLIIIGGEISDAKKEMLLDLGVKSFIPKGMNIRKEIMKILVEISS